MFCYSVIIDKDKNCVLRKLTTCLLSHVCPGRFCCKNLPASDKREAWRGELKCIIEMESGVTSPILSVYHFNSFLGTLTGPDVVFICITFARDVCGECLGG